MPNTDGIVLHRPVESLMLGFGHSHCTSNVLGGGSVYYRRTLYTLTPVMITVPVDLYVDVWVRLSLSDAVIQIF